MSGVIKNIPKEFLFHFKMHPLCCNLTDIILMSASKEPSKPWASIVNSCCSHAWHLLTKARTNLPCDMVKISNYVFKGFLYESHWWQPLRWWKGELPRTSKSCTSKAASVALPHRHPIKVRDYIIFSCRLVGSTNFNNQTNWWIIKCFVVETCP